MFSLLRSEDWSDVLAAWRDREADIWRAHYTECGFETWDAWRQTYIEDFGLPDRTWTIERVVDPRVSVPGLFVGSYNGWAKYYSAGKSAATFSEIARHPEIRANTGVQYWLDHVPDKTQIIAFRCGDEVVVRDGTHRCAAIAVAVADDLPFACEVEAAIAEFSLGEHNLFLKAIDQRCAKHVDSH